MADTLLESQLLPPPNPWPLRLGVGLLLALLVGGAIYWQFRYYPEEKLVRQFMDALVAGDYQTAYRVWNATEAYSYQAFLEDWGETTSFGRIRSYDITDVRPTSGAVLQVPKQGEQRGRNLRVTGRSSGVVVSVRINGIEPPVRLWVEMNPPRLAFPPY